MDPLLQTTLANVVQQLANFFGMTTEVIMQNAPMWLAKYGWFALMQNLPSTIILWAFVVIGGIFFIAFTGAWFECKVSSVVKVCIAWGIVLTILIFATWFLQCAICPELYGLNKLLVLLK